MSCCCALDRWCINNLSINLHFKSPLNCVFWRTSDSKSIINFDESSLCWRNNCIKRSSICWREHCCLNTFNCLLSCLTCYKDHKVITCWEVEQSLRNDKFPSCCLLSSVHWNWCWAGSCSTSAGNRDWTTAISALNASDWNCDVYWLSLDDLGREDYVRDLRRGDFIDQIDVNWLGCFSRSDVSNNLDSILLLFLKSRGVKSTIYVERDSSGDKLLSCAIKHFNCNGFLDWGGISLAIWVEVFELSSKSWTILSLNYFEDCWNLLTEDVRSLFRVNNCELKLSDWTLL